MPELPRPHRELPHDDARLTRIWPSLALAILAPCLAMLPIVLIFWDRITVTAEASQELMKEAPFIAAMLIAWPLTLLLLSVGAAFASRVNPETRVGLLPPVAMPPWVMPVFALGVVGLSQVAELIAALLSVEPAEGLSNLSLVIDQAAGLNKWLILLAIVVGSPIAEEMFYRGYVLRGLMRRWLPWQAIFFTAWFYSLPQGEVSSQLEVLCMGLYLGWIAYRTRSIWPGVVANTYFSLFITVQLVLPQEQRQWMSGDPRMPGAFEIAHYLALVFALVVLSRRELWPQDSTARQVLVSE